jgi:hypothetical protein
VAKHLEGWFKIHISCLVYSQIWQNLPKDHCQIFYIFFWIVTTSAPKRKFLQKKTLVCRLAAKNMLLILLVLLCYYFSAKLSQIEIPIYPFPLLLWWPICRLWTTLLDPSLLGTLLTIKPTFYYSYQPTTLSPHWSAEPFTHISLKFAIQLFFIADNEPDKFELLVAINVKLGYSERFWSFRRIYMNCGPCQLSS